MVEIYIDNAGGVRKDISRLWEKLVWSGSKQSCARTAEFTIPSADTDRYLPQTDIHLSDHVEIRYGETCLLDGFVSSLKKTSDMGFLTVRVHDRGLAMNCNEAVFDFQNTMPAEAVKKICSSFGISVGTLPDTGEFRLTRKFIGVSLYRILATFYTKASAVTGKHYALGFRGADFCVWELTPSTMAEIPLLKPSNNLLTALVTENNENVINRVICLDSSDSQILIRADEQSELTHGTRQRILKAADDPDGQAKQLLEEGSAPNRKISVTCLADPSLISGKHVRVQDPQNGLDQVFAIAADTHTWSDGNCTCVLTLEANNNMTEIDAGE